MTNNTNRIQILLASMKETNHVYKTANTVNYNPEGFAFIGRVKNPRQINVNIPAFIASPNTSTLSTQDRVKLRNLVL